MNRLLVALLVILVVITKSRDRPQLALDPLLQLLAFLLQPLEVLLQARCLLRTKIVTVHQGPRHYFHDHQFQYLVVIFAFELSFNIITIINLIQTTSSLAVFSYLICSLTVSLNIILIWSSSPSSKLSSSLYQHNHQDQHHHGHHHYHLLSCRLLFSNLLVDRVSQLFHGGAHRLHVAEEDWVSAISNHLDFHGG